MVEKRRDRMTPDDMLKKFGELAPPKKKDREPNVRQRKPEQVDEEEITLYELCIAALALSKAIGTILIDLDLTDEDEIEELAMEQAALLEQNIEVMDDEEEQPDDNDKEA